MGICESKGAPSERKKENETDNPLIQLDTDMIDATKSVCMVMTNEGNGTGFLLKAFKVKKMIMFQFN